MQLGGGLVVAQLVVVAGRSLETATMATADAKFGLVLALARRLDYRHVEVGGGDCQEDEWERFLYRMVAESQRQLFFLRADCDEGHQQEEEEKQSLLHLKGRGMVFFINWRRKRRIPSSMRGQVEFYFPEEVGDLGRGLKLDSRVFRYGLHQEENDGDGAMTIREIYRVKDREVTNLIGWWDPHSGLSVPETRLWHRRRDFGGVRLEATHLSIRRDRPPTRDSIFISSVLQEIQTFFNFTILESFPHLSHGTYDPTTGNWTRQMGELSACTADLSTNVLGITPARVAVADFTLPLKEIEIGLIFPVGQMRVAVMNIWAYLGDAFSPSAWLVIALVLTCAGLVFSSSYGKLQYKKAVEVVFKTILLISLNIQDRISTFIAYLTISLACLMFSAGYNAMLTSTMTMGYAEISIRSLRDAIDAGYEVLTIPHTATQHELCSAPSGTAMWEICRHHPKFEMGQIEVEVARRPRTAFYGVQSEQPGIRFVRLEGGHEGGRGRRLFGFGLCKDSEFLEPFNQQLLSMSSTGVIDRLQKSLYKAPDSGGRAEESGNPGVIMLSYEHVVFPFLLLGGGVAVGALLVVLEYCIKLKRCRTSMIAL